MKWPSGVLVSVLSILISLQGAGCGRDPGKRIEHKYGELVELIKKSRGSPDRAVSEANAWFKKSDADFTSICEDLDRLKQSDPDAATRAVLDHGIRHREAQKELDRLIERWEPAARLKLSALMVDLSQICLPDAQKIIPFR